MHEYEVKDIETDRYAYVTADTLTEAKNAAIEKWGYRFYEFRLVS